MIARRMTAPRPTSTPGNSTESSTVAWEWTWTAGESTERRTSPPETTTPPHTIESSACPIRSGSAKTNFAGGSGDCHVRIGHSML
jgi:hypothetical protein